MPDIGKNSVIRLPKGSKIREHYTRAFKKTQANKEVSDFTKWSERRPNDAEVLERTKKYNPQRLPPSTMEVTPNEYRGIRGVFKDAGPRKTRYWKGPSGG